MFSVALLFVVGPIFLIFFGPDITDLIDWTQNIKLLPFATPPPKLICKIYV